MLRGARPVVQAALRAPRSLARASFTNKASPPQFSKRPAIASATCLAPLSSKASYANSPHDKIDIAAEKEIAKKKLEARPEKVSTESSTRQVFEPSPSPAGDENIQEGLGQEIGIVRDTFRMDDVPRENYVLGLAGTLPYLATSISTVYLSWNLNASWPSNSSFLNHIYLNHDSAQYALGLLEPIQLGYGAVIISFLGAVHWGMEYTATDSSPDRTRFRYGIGVIAPAIAWPTLLMPVEAALISQFAAFTFLYFVDSRASTRGWAPPWYSRYRFILTAIVGVAIFVSLVGRAKIGADAPRIGQGLSDTIQATDQGRNVDWEKLEAEEKEKNRKAAEAAAKNKESKSKKEGEQDAKTDEEKKDN